MSNPAARRLVVTTLQELSKDARAIISVWRPDGGFASRRGPAKPKPEGDRQSWDQVARIALSISDRALGLATYAKQQRDALPADTADEHVAVDDWTCSCGWKVDGFTAPEVAAEKLALKHIIPMNEAAKDRAGR